MVQKFGKDPEYINDFSRALLDGFYLQGDETFDDALARAAEAFCFGDYDLAQRIYEAAWKGWFMFASPILSNAPKGEWYPYRRGPSVEHQWQMANSQDWFDHKVQNDFRNYSETWMTNNFNGDDPRAMPISCFAMYVPDTIDGQMDANKELAALSVAGGGVGLHNGIRATSDKAPGPIPYMKTMDGLIGYYQQSKNRRGACAYYMDVDHPDIIEHIRFRIPSGGDSSRKSDNRKQFHSAVNITQKFIDAVLADAEFDLKDPHTQEVRETLPARQIWEELLETRALTGEPYLFKIDTANKALPQTQKDKGLEIKGSNICIEITLPSNEERTFVCCLSSLNLEKYDEWADSGLVTDLVRYLDNVIQYFIERAPESLNKARYSAWAERAIGIGTMGWHSYLQSKMIPFEGGGFGSGIQQTHMIFNKMKKEAVAASEQLAIERGEPDDLVGSGRRNSALFAIAPNSNNSVILDVSPSIEPVSGNTYSQSTRAGTFTVKNKWLDKLLYDIGLGLDGIYDQDEWVNDQWKDIIAHDGSCQHLDYLSEDEKEVFKTAFEIDQHWVIEQAEARAQYVCQSQSLNLFFPAGVSRQYYNSVHLKAMVAEHIKSLYYSRMERGVNADVVKEIERKVIEDWASDDCVACSG